jgi:hypothetical protein
VRYDDRLLTVLSQPDGDRHDAAVRWRQLVDLVARAGSHAASPTVARAIEEIRRDSLKVDEDLRAAAARAVAALPLPLGLLEYFASDRLAVCAPVLAAASLEEGEWRALLVVADPETRCFIETLHPQLRPEPWPELWPERPAELNETPIERPPEQPVEVSGPSLHDVVERIERRRRNHAQHQPTTAGVIAGSPGLFRWECGPGGEIAWVEGAPRGPLIGRSIARVQEGNGDRVDAQVIRAFAMRTPFRDAAMTVGGEGPVAGEWKISGIPAFEPVDGRFAGYRGVASRDAPSVLAAPEAADALADPDSLRELVHEIKTPLNAIIGFAEIIDGQYLGPADRRYRERAGEIVAQARLLLTAIDDLDFAAKVHMAGGNRSARADLGEIVGRLAPSLHEMALARGVDLEWSTAVGNLKAAVEPELADRLIFRLASAVIERAESGEAVRLVVECAADGCRLSISRPAALRGLTDAELFGAAEGDSVGSAGFILRLARGLARVAGTELVATPAVLRLNFRCS